MYYDCMRKRVGSSARYPKLTILYPKKPAPEGMHALWYLFSARVNQMPRWTNRPNYTFADTSDMVLGGGERECNRSLDIIYTGRLMFFACEYMYLVWAVCGA